VSFCSVHRSKGVTAGRRRGPNRGITVRDNSRSSPPVPIGARLFSPQNFLLHARRVDSEMNDPLQGAAACPLAYWKPPTTEVTPQLRGASFLRIDSAGCIIVTIGLPDPGQLFAHPYISTPHVPRSSPKENLRAPQSNSFARPSSLFNPRHTAN